MYAYGHINVQKASTSDSRSARDQPRVRAAVHTNTMVRRSAVSNTGSADTKRSFHWKLPGKKSLAATTKGTWTARSTTPFRGHSTRSAGFPVSGEVAFLR